MKKNYITGSGIFRNIVTEFKIGRWLRCKGYCQEPKSVEETAVEIGVDRDLLCWYCSSHLHTTFTIWRKQLRINEAKRIIGKTPDIPMALAGKMAGIPDRSNFRKQFHEVTGLYPNEWADICKLRRQARNHLFE